MVVVVRLVVELEGVAIDVSGKNSEVMSSRLLEQAAAANATVQASSRRRFIGKHSYGRARSNIGKQAPRPKQKGERTEKTGGEAAGSL